MKIPRLGDVLQFSYAVLLLQWSVRAHQPLEDVFID